MDTMPPISLRLSAEFFGTLFLLATVVGSGIMAENLAQGNAAIALLGNTLATGAILVVLITILGRYSGAHFNPAVSFAMWLRKELSTSLLALYIAVQVAGGVGGVWIAHVMFETEIIQFSTKHRSGFAQCFAEFVAAFGLVATILGTLRVRPNAVAAMVGLYISAGYWFTASTSFANPAVTVARSLTDTFSGIHPIDAPWFIVAQFLGAVAAFGAFYWVDKKHPTEPT